MGGQGGEKEFAYKKELKKGNISNFWGHAFRKRDANTFSRCLWAESTGISPHINPGAFYNQLMEKDCCMLKYHSGRWRKKLFSWTCYMEEICATVGMTAVRAHDNSWCTFHSSYMPRSMLSDFKYHLISPSPRISKVQEPWLSAHFQNWKNGDIERQLLGLNLGDWETP